MTVATVLIVFGGVLGLLGLSVAFYGLYALSVAPTVPPVAAGAGPSISTRFRQMFDPLDDIILNVVQSALAEEERFGEVRVEVRNGIVNLSGRVKTGTDKWDARNAVWLKAQPRTTAKIEAVFNNIVSEEPDPMPAARPGTAEDPAWAANRLGFSATVPAFTPDPPSHPLAGRPDFTRPRLRTGHPYWDERPDAPPAPDKR